MNVIWDNNGITILTNVNINKHVWMNTNTSMRNYLNACLVLLRAQQLVSTIFMVLVLILVINLTLTSTTITADVQDISTGNGMNQPRLLVQVFHLYVEEY